MTNWCENKLTIKGPREELLRFVNIGKGKVLVDEEQEEIPLCFNNFVPMPEELVNTVSHSQKKYKKLLKRFGSDNWYDWSINNWGTKWPPLSVVLVNSKIFHITPSKPTQNIVYGFDTAWSPPEPIIAKMSKMFPKLRFKLEYWEAGYGFRGILIMKDSKIIKDCTYDYSGSRGG